jgi:hypothetical protein
VQLRACGSKEGAARLSLFHGLKPVAFTVILLRRIEAGGRAFAENVQ